MPFRRIRANALVLSTFSAHTGRMSSAFSPNPPGNFPDARSRDILPRAMLGRAKADEPLSEREDRALDRALRALHRELRATLATLPVEAQTASGLARRLRIERTTCQRAVSTAVNSYAGPAMVGQLPGAEGLRLLASAATRAFASQADTVRAAEMLSRAIDAYEEAIRRIGGSRSKLLTRLRVETASATQPSSGGSSENSDARLRLFEAAAALTGRQSRAWLAAHIYEPTHEADRLIQTRAHGLIGHAAREDAVPLTFHVFATPPSGADTHADENLGRFYPLEASSEGPAPSEILRQFSSSPIPVVRARQPNEFLVQTVETSPDAPSAGCDIVFGLTGMMAHPGKSPPFLEEVWALINFPVCWLLLDVFLHRDIARNCIPGLDVHLWRPDFASTVGERWQTRFTTSPKLQVLSGDLSQAGADSYSRHPELLAYLFAKRNLNPAHFVGYRCETPFPMWRTGYRLTFDFGETNAASDGPA